MKCLFCQMSRVETEMNGIGDMRYRRFFFHLGELWLEFEISLRGRQLAFE